MSMKPKNITTTKTIEDIKWFMDYDKLVELAGKYPNLTFDVEHWCLGVQGDPVDIFKFLEVEDSHVRNWVLKRVVDGPHFTTKTEKPAAYWNVYAN